MYDPRDGAWRKWGDRDERDLDEWGEWGDGTFAAAAEAGKTNILKLLIAEGCYKDQMGLKGVEVAVESGSTVIVECCYSTDIGRDEDGYILNEQFVRPRLWQPLLFKRRWQAEILEWCGLF